ncbi:MAG: hypothetical protein ACF8QF_12820 [Phycisphaerales bacterium]
MITVDGRLRRLEQRNRALWCALAIAVVANFGAVGALWMRAPDASSAPMAAATPAAPSVESVVAERPSEEPVVRREAQIAAAPVEDAPTRPALPSAPGRLVARAIDLVDDSGMVRARLHADAGAAQLELLDDQGAALTTLGPGGLRLAAPDNESMATLTPDRLWLGGDMNAGAIALERSASGGVGLSFDDASGARPFEARADHAGARFMFDDGAGSTTAFEDGAIAMAGPAGVSRLGAGAFEIAGPASGAGVSISATGQGGRVELSGASGEVVARLGAGSTGDGELETFDSAGRRLASIVATAEGQGGLFAFNALGNLAMQLAADEAGDGVLRVNNRLGQSRFILTTGPRDEASMFTVDVRGRLVPVLGAEAAARRARADAGGD